MADRLVQDFPLFPLGLVALPGEVVLPIPPRGIPALVRRVDAPALVRYLDRKGVERYSDDP